MTTLQLRIPPSLNDRLKQLAAREGVSIEDFVSMAVVEKIATLETADYLSDRAKRGSREKLLAILAKASDVEPEERDRL